MTNQPTKKQRGGDRGGRKPKNPNKRVTVSVCLDPENLELRKRLGRGWNDEVNRLLDAERRSIADAEFIKSW